MFFSLVGRHDFKSRALKVENVKELCWAEGRLAVGYPYSIISFVQKEKDVNEPLVYFITKKDS